MNIGVDFLDPTSLHTFDDSCRDMLLKLHPWSHQLRTDEKWLAESMF
jgi:hypothetical protein